MGEAEWLPKKIANDLNNNGMQDMMWHVKSDQEPASVTLQSAIQDLCPNRVIPTNSPVGESACNGRVENAIKRVQEKVRALRHQVEDGMKAKIPEDSPLMAWLVRWAAELLSRYAPGGRWQVSVRKDQEGEMPHTIGAIRRESDVFAT